MITSISIALYAISLVIAMVAGMEAEKGDRVAAKTVVVVSIALFILAALLQIFG